MATDVKLAADAFGENCHLCVKQRVNNLGQERTGLIKATRMTETKQPAQFDPETVALLREALDDAWSSLRPDQRARMSRTLLAEGIIKSAAEGERDPERLRDAALKVGLSHPLN